MYQAMATIVLGWALTKQGFHNEGIEQMREGLAGFQATSTELLRPHFFALMAEALGETRQPEDGLRGLEESLDSAHRNGEAGYLAELYRMKGELLLMQGAGRDVSRAATGGRDVFAGDPASASQAQAESCFGQAISVAQQQKAKSLELRAVMSLARLYQNKGKPEEARILFTEIYGTFNEGFDTKDLREAKALLDHS